MSAPGKPRLLFVDDEPGIRLTLPVILSMHGFEVRTADSVPEALKLISSETFDILLSDLNIGDPGDGFTVVSAMRRTQPKALTMILTGYPAFETALEAIRRQVDEYFVKPASVDALVARMKEKLELRGTHQPPPMQRVSYILEKNREMVVDHFLKAIIQRPHFPVEGFSRAELQDNLGTIVEAIISMLRKGEEDAGDSLRAVALEHGRRRAEQGFTAALMVEEVGLLRSAVFAVIQENLLAIDVSFLLSDMIALSELLDRRLQDSLLAFSDAPVPRAR